MQVCTKDRVVGFPLHKAQHERHTSEADRMTSQRSILLELESKTLNETLPTVSSEDLSPNQKRCLRCAVFLSLVLYLLSVFLYSISVPSQPPPPPRAGITVLFLHHEVHQLHRPLAHVVPQPKPTGPTGPTSDRAGDLMAAQGLPLGTATLEGGRTELQLAIVGIRLTMISHSSH